MLTCEKCGSRVVVIEGPLQDDAEVCCGECGEHRGDYRTLMSWLRMQVQVVREAGPSSPLVKERVALSS